MGILIHPLAGGEADRRPLNGAEDLALESTPRVDSHLPQVGRAAP